jgi:hypothetical protein
MLHLIGGLGDSPVGKQHSGKPLSANHVALHKRLTTANFVNECPAHRKSLERAHLSMQCLSG